MSRQFYSGIQSRNRTGNRGSAPTLPQNVTQVTQLGNSGAGNEVSIEQVLATVSDHKKLTDTLLKQNTSLLMLNAKLVKDMENLKAHTSDLQCSTIIKINK